MKRKTNQDSICLYHQRKTLHAVADGMGGHNGGDIASQMSVKLYAGIPGRK
jgi:serine/threonine protein phosphatase PrpC